MIVSDKLGVKVSEYINYTEGQTLIKKPATLQMGFTDGTLELTSADGIKSLYEPLQLNFHSPSEHTVNGRHYDLEMQMVHLHKEDLSIGAILSVFFDRSASNESNEFIRSLQIDKASEYGQ